MRVTVSALTTLPAAELARLVALRVRPSSQADAIVDDVREQVLWVARGGGWTDPDLFEQEVATAAQRLVPPNDAHRLTEFSLIAAAAPYLRLPECGTVWTELMRLIGEALRMAYAEAIRNLVRWAQQQTPIAGRQLVRSGSTPD